jgi:hypothetical protein
VSDRHSNQVLPNEERLHVHARIFQLLENDTFRTQCQFNDVFCWHTEFYQDHEDHVDVHWYRLLSLPAILLTQVTVTLVPVVVIRLQVAVS